MAPSRLGRLFHGVLTIGLCIFVLVPFGWMVSTSLKPIGDTHLLPAALDSGAGEPAGL